MADTINDITQQINTDIRNKIANKSVTRDNVSDSLQKIADNQRPDWNETDTNSLTYIQNKPSINSIILQGTIFFGDINGNPSGSLSVTGDILTATKTNIGDSDYVDVTFNNLGSSNYLPQLFISTSDDVNNRGVTTLKFRNRTNTSFQIGLGEVIQESQDITIFLNIITFNG